MNFIQSFITIWFLWWKKDSGSSHDLSDVGGNFLAFTLCSSVEMSMEKLKKIPQHYKEWKIHLMRKFIPSWGTLRKCLYGYRRPFDQFIVKRDCDRGLSHGPKKQKTLVEKATWRKECWRKCPAHMYQSRGFVQEGGSCTVLWGPRFLYVAPLSHGMWIPFRLSISDSPSRSWVVIYIRWTHFLMASRVCGLG